MLKKINCSLVLLAFSLLLVSCGGKDDKSSVEEISNNFLGGKPCGFNVISDQNDYALACGRLKFSEKVEDVRNCRSKMQSFIDKYPGINCLAEKSSDTSVNNEQFIITEAAIKEVIEDIDEFLKERGL